MTRIITPFGFTSTAAEVIAGVDLSGKRCIVTGGRDFGPSGAAAKLGVARSTLDSKIKALKIDKNRFKVANPSCPRGSSKLKFDGCD